MGISDARKFSKRWSGMSFVNRYHVNAAATVIMPGGSALLAWDESFVICWLVFQCEMLFWGERLGYHASSRDH